MLAKSLLSHCLRLMLLGFALSYQVVSAADTEVARLIALGEQYAQGKDVAVDIQKARAYFQQAAELGDAGAMVQLGGWYADGRLGKKDFKQAHQWFEKAAALGAAEGWRNLGLLNENGDGVARDYVKAFAYYQRAVDAGSSIAASALGHFYENGLGIPVAPALAEFWYKKSIAEGFMGAKDALGRMYMRQEKYDQAVVLIRERADISVAALMLLYPMYARGLGVARNDVVGLSVSLLVMELTKGKVGEANMIRAVLPADQQAIAKRLFELYMEQRRVIPIIDAYLATGKVPD